MSNAQATSIIRYFRSILSDTSMSDLFCLTLLSVCILKSHSSLFSTGFIHWSWLARGCNIFHPCHNPTFLIGPSESPVPFVVPPTSILLLSNFLAFRYNMTNCLITFSAHSTLCRHIMILLVNYPLYVISS